MQRYYNKSTLNNAKKLRHDLTEPEQILWSKLRNRRLNNIKFLRQVPISNYIADFLCQEKRLIIELDGAQHLESSNIIKDKERTKYLEKLNYHVIRIYNNDIFNNLDNVLEYIYAEYLKL